ncbi:esterase-like activity of phytase family protein [Siphonobacter sp. SORGH_AS_0500]|uniref:esterase-like activity of phytase family protein n=1 Tax=Siphonobacter sp. SORGH_AS_0500 TaxID=1864824 RepID=UPI002855606B|nr:esterase-like activity of phytase family protein [Siphonobacter sp. SORGH_AS_0500]MDR6194802.1 hypothetical protein [Siphonobacter sp. SORGH_AS_0500]
MKTIGLFFLLWTAALVAEAQHFRLELLKWYNLSDSTTLQNDPYFGGLSGIEYVPKLGKWYLVTDGADSTRQSYLFEFDSLFNTWNYKRWKLNKIHSAESVRFDKADSSLYFTTELGAEKTYGEFLKLKKDSTVHTLASYQDFEDNKGFEAMALDSNRVLWGASEWPQTPNNPYCQVTGYGLNQGDTLVRALYPLDRNACGYPDNGISEMLLARDGQLLFLERCWTGERDQSNYSIRLFTTYIPKTGSTVGSQSTSLLEKNPVEVNWGGVHLDNIEGMSWGPIVNGNRTLVLISDNNFNKFDRNKTPENRQKSQLIILKVLPD